MYTLDYSEDQLHRLYSRVDSNQHLRIIHLLWDDSSTIEDRYIVLVDCDPATYTMLLML